MNEKYESILARRSIKKYTDTPVPQELLDAVIKAGTYAPTASNKMSPLIISVENKDERDAVERLNSTSVGRAPGKTFYGAPNLIIVFAERGNPNSVQDASLVLANLMHAANALGLGSCWINRAKESFETEEGKALLVKWGVDPDKWVGVGNCILGYADGEPAPQSPRKDGYVVRVK